MLYDFVFRLRHDATETFQKLQRARGNGVLSSVSRFSSGLRRIQMAEIRSKGERPSGVKYMMKASPQLDGILSDSQLTVRTIGERLEVNSHHQVLTGDSEINKCWGRKQ